MGIVDRIGALAGTETAKAVNFAHETFLHRHSVHGHTSRALLETAAEVCRNHPNLVGLGAGLMVEQFLVHEKHVHDGRQALNGGAPATTNGAPHPQGLHLPHLEAPHLSAPHLHAPHIEVPQLGLPPIRLDRIRPGKVGMEVFGALVLLKFGRGMARALRRSHADPWFAPAAKIHLLSGSLAAYYLAKALKAKKVSAWRNAAIALFATDAVKPLLKARKGAFLPPPPRPAAAAPPPQPEPPPPPMPERRPPNGGLAPVTP